MFEKFETRQHFTGDASTPVKCMQPALFEGYPRKKKHKGKGKHKGKKHSEIRLSNKQLLALAIQELGASNRSMAAALSEIACQGKVIPQASIEASNFLVGEENEKEI